MQENETRSARAQKSSRNKNASFKFRKDDTVNNGLTIRLAASSSKSSSSSDKNPRRSATQTRITSRTRNLDNPPIINFSEPAPPCHSTERISENFLKLIQESKGHTVDGTNNKKFSSRNSLRQSSTQQESDDGKKANANANQASTKTDKMCYNIDFKTIRSTLNHMLEFNLDDPSKYTELRTEYFVRPIGAYLCCLLCPNREALNRDHNSSINRHIDSQYHCNRFIELKNLIADQLPKESSFQSRLLSEFVKGWLLKNTVTPQMISLREQSLQDFYSLLREINTDCYCQVIGSFSNGTSLTTSDVNVELIHPNSWIFEDDPKAKNSMHHKLISPDAEYGEQFNNHTLHYDLIPNALDTLHKIGTAIKSGFTTNKSFELISQIAELNSKIPKLKLMHRYNNVQLEICCKVESRRELTDLLAVYLSLDERVKYLSVLVKYWAKECSISTPPGTYPPETYVIMVIYFLQRTDPPILPCLHEMLNKSRNEARSTVQRNSPPQQSSTSPKSTSSAQTVNHKDEYVPFNQFERLFLTGAEENSKSHGPTSDKNQQIVNKSNEEEFEEELEDEDQFQEFNPELLQQLNWCTSNNSTSSNLFIQFMRFMIDEFNDCNTVISIRTLQRVTVSMKNWSTQWKAIENPVRPSCNLSRVIGSHRIYQYLRNCFRHAFYYLNSIPLDKNLRVVESFREDPRELMELYINTERLDFYYDMKSSTLESLKSRSLVHEMIQQNLFARDVEVIRNLISHSMIHKTPLATVISRVAQKFQLKMFIPPDMGATKYCWLCKQNGHQRDHCPRARMRSIPPELLNNNLDLFANLDDNFLYMYHRAAITKDISDKHQAIVSSLTSSIRKKAKLDCKLTLFGSTVNNLGSYDSDLDICLTLEGNPTGNGVDCVETLKKVHDVIVDLKTVEDVEAIYTARVPILKFKFRNFDIDLSMYNQCAIHNSKLLKAYAEIDERLPQLFFLVKKYAKACGIADASKGSLSSYAWSLMVIHYLQQVHPPILPCLQDKHRDMDVRGMMIGVNGWNVWFNDNVNSMNPKNDMTLTQLFKDFLLYFSQFDFDQYIVSIRFKNRITRFQKNWTNCMIAIEDPFELTYNLSSRLDDMMSIYILNSFRGAYIRIAQYQQEVICSPSSSFLIPQDFESCIFDGFKITGERKPPFRGCRQCQRVGHKFADCPERRKVVPRDSAFVKLKSAAATALC